MLDADIDKFNEKVYNKITTCQRSGKVGDELAQRIRRAWAKQAYFHSHYHCGSWLPNRLFLCEVLRRHWIVLQSRRRKLHWWFSALVRRYFTSKVTEKLYRFHSEAMVTDFVCSSVNIGTSRNGINMDVLSKEMGVQSIKQQNWQRQRIHRLCKTGCLLQCLWTTPFMAGAFHARRWWSRLCHQQRCGVNGQRCETLESRGEDFETLCKTVKRTAFKITRVVRWSQKKRPNAFECAPFGIDLSLAPTPAVGDNRKLQGKWVWLNPVHLVQQQLWLCWTTTWKRRRYGILLRWRSERCVRHSTVSRPW